MRERVDEEPEPEPDEDEPSTGQSVVPSVAPAGRDYEYRTDTLTSGDVVEGKKLIELLNTSAADGWDLVEIIAAGDSHVVLQRKSKAPKRDSRRVGFTFPGS